MPAERLPMRKVREVLRQRYACGASERVIAVSLGIGRTAVGEYIRRAAVIGITWPVPDELDDAALERKLFAPAGYNPPRSKPLPDWAHVHAELRRRGVTLALLWQDYRGQHPDGYGYSRFCDLYGEWRRGVTATMRQTHVAGEKLFVDFAGDTMPVFDAITGEVRDTKIFVAVLGASNYTYAEARFSEGLPDWIGAHVNALAFLGGVPKAIVCDNLKAGVTTASRYEPGVNRTYQDLAAHYGTTIMPTRPRKPRDKAKVEVAVLIVERWILARLRDRRFFSLAELNVAIRALVDELNDRLMRKLGASRREFFETIDRPALMPLPGRALSVCRMAARPRRPGLPRRGSRALLLGAVPADPPGGRGADHAGHRRGVPPRRAGCQSRAFARQTAAYDHPRAHAERAPSVCLLDAGAHARRRQKDRPLHGGAVRGDHAGQAASRTGLPVLPRHPLARPLLWSGPPRSGLPPWRRHRRGELSLDRLHPQDRPRQGLHARSRTGRRSHPSRQHPRPWLLPLTSQKETSCSSTTPMNASPPSDFPAWPRPSTISSASPMPQP